MLEDQRLRTFVRELCGQHGLVAGLKRVAREYAAAPYMAATSDPILEQRAIELESLCLLVAVVASDLPLPTQGEVLIVAERLTAIGALCAVGGRAAGVAASAPLSAPDLGPKIAVAAQLPVLADIQGLFAWVRPEDTLLLDCEQGLLRVNPPATTIARYRHHGE
jgi:phosphoenolpyruvate-protein kinase (PTS system EI component)